MFFSKPQLAETYKISVPTITKMIGNVPASGRRNGGMVWHLSDVTKMLDIRKTEEEESKSEPEEVVTDPEKMPPAERRLHYQAEDLKEAAQIKARRNAVESGQLLEAADVEKVLAQAFKTLALTLDTLPDLFERDGLVQSSDVQRVIEIVDNSRSQIASDLSKLSTLVSKIEDSGEW
jgi:phage terminase Nu1 subunit (DNA packaging protein)